MIKKSNWDSIYDCRICDSKPFKADAVEYNDGVIVFYLLGDVVASCGSDSVFIRLGKSDDANRERTVVTRSAWGG